MKKVFCLVMLVVAFTTINSENAFAAKPDSGYDYVYYGPMKGDFSLSFSAVPLVNFVGNMFNGTSRQSISQLSGLSSSLFDGSTITGTYFISDRVGFTAGIGFNNSSTKSYEYDRKFDEVQGVEKSGSKATMFMLGANYLLRPGKRLQPVLGASLVYSYANKGYTDVDDKSDANEDYYQKSPSNSFGIIGNIGVEYYLCKSISLAAFLDLGLTTTANRVKYIDDNEKEISYVTSRDTEFMTGKLGGNLAINFYF